MDVPADVEDEGESESIEADASQTPRPSFDERFKSSFEGQSVSSSFDDRFAPSSFEERFAPGGENVSEPASEPIPMPRPGALARLEQKPTSVPPRDSAKPDGSRVALGQPATDPGPVPPPRAAAPRSDSPPLPQPDADAHTAIYDITGHAVYMPNGDKLEAHSGFGSDLDDPRSIAIRGRGPTPPNVYKLQLREQLFHGVQAIRLVPAGDGKMFGRAGILAHPYMLGPNGQSNGCISFNDYPAFLNAFLKGDVNRIVVVERLDNPPTAKTGVAWISESLKDIFKPLQHAVQYADFSTH